jgi:hypothetical protein
MYASNSQVWREVAGGVMRPGPAPAIAARLSCGKRVEALRRPFEALPRPLCPAEPGAARVTTVSGIGRGS